MTVVSHLYLKKSYLSFRRTTKPGGTVAFMKHLLLPVQARCKVEKDFVARGGKLYRITGTPFKRPLHLLAINKTTNQWLLSSPGYSEYDKVSKQVVVVAVQYIIYSFGDGSWRECDKAEANSFRAHGLKPSSEK